MHYLTKMDALLGKAKRLTETRSCVDCGKKIASQKDLCQDCRIDRTYGERRART